MDSKQFLMSQSLDHVVPIHPLRLCVN